MPVKDDQASLIHANAFGAEHALLFCTSMLMYKTFDLQSPDNTGKQNELNLASGIVTGPAMRPLRDMCSAITERICEGLPRWSVIKCSTVFHTLLSRPQGH